MAPELGRLVEASVASWERGVPVIALPDGPDINDAPYNFSTHEVVSRKIGVPDRTQTCDLMLRRHSLYSLSYRHLNRLFLPSRYDYLHCHRHLEHRHRDWYRVRLVPSN